MMTQRRRRRRKLSYTDYVAGRTVTGAVIGLVLAALICWLWLVTIHGVEDNWRDNLTVELSGFIHGNPPQSFLFSGPITGMTEAISEATLVRCPTDYALASTASCAPPS
jgi:hypothetical protein